MGDCAVFFRVGGAGGSVNRSFQRSLIEKENSPHYLEFGEFWSARPAEGPRPHRAREKVALNKRVLTRARLSRVSTN